MKRRFVFVSAVAVLVSLLALGALAAPSDGNGKKAITDIEASDIPIFCDGDDVPDLWLDVDGFIQEKGFAENSPNEFLAVYHINERWRNSAGDSWVWRDRGPGPTI